MIASAGGNELRWRRCSRRSPLGFLVNMMFVVDFAHGAGDDADHAGGVRAAASAMANGHRGVVRRCVACGAGLERIAPVACDRPQSSLTDYQTPQVQVNEPTASGSRLRVLAEIAAVLRRSAGDRPRHRLDARPVRAGRDRPRSAPRAEVVSNPHNQTLNVAVQWGAIGVVVLYAMWLAPSAAVSRRRSGGMDRTDGRRAEYLHLAVQFASVRFSRGLDVCAGRRRRRRHGARRRRDRQDQRYER